VGLVALLPLFSMKGGSFMGKIDWDVVTNFTDAVTTTLKTVTFPKVQEQVYLRNQGNANFTYTIGSQSGTLTPGQSVTVNQDVSSFTLQAVSGTHTFELRAKEKGTEIEEIGSNLPSDVAGKTQLFSRLQNKQVTKIKLIGDSITAGAQCTGYNVPANGRIILTGSRFNDGGAGYAREAGTDWTTFPSWANLFRKYINTNYPSIDFFNAGIGGLSLNEVLANYLTQIVTNTEDVLFIMLGVNDRASYSLSTFEANMRTFLDYAKARSNLIVLMSPPPTLSEFTSNTPSSGFAAGYNFGSREIDNIYLKLSKEYNLPFISNYTKSSNYLAKTNTAFYGVRGINADYTHPNTLGYKVVWQSMQEELGFISDISEWFFGNKDFIAYPDAPYNRVTSSTLLNDALFQDSSVTYDLISTAGSGATGFPETASGTLKTVKPKSSFYDWGYQEYQIYRKNNKYIRYWNGSAWGVWVKLNINSNGEFSFNDFSSSVDPSASITTYTEKVVRYDAVANNQTYAANFPEGKGGTLETIRQVVALDNWTIQKYYVYQSNTVYKRYWTGSAWSTWKRISGSLSLTTAQRTALSAVGLSKGDQVFDETLNKPVWRNATNDGWVDATGTTV
jgi:lysophospholipase L1-like esterase